MFIKKDLRKIPRILEDAAIGEVASDDRRNSRNEGEEPSSKRSKRNILTDLKLARRPSEFNGSLKFLCQPKNVPALSNLVSLSVYDCQITSLEGIGLFGSSVDGRPVSPNLATLNLGRNPIETLPEELGNLKRSLKELWCDDCKITGEIPPSVLNLRKLRLLQLANNRVTEIPPAIQNLDQLESLCLDRNEIESVPKELGFLKKLRSLMLRNNTIQSLPEGVPGPDMPDLTLFHVSSNKLRSLPDSLTSCTSLECLYINSNELDNIPDGLARSLIHLKRLNLTSNNLEALTVEFTDRFGEPDRTTGVCDKDSGCTVYAGQNPVQISGCFMKPSDNGDVVMAF